MSGAIPEELMTIQDLMLQIEEVARGIRAHYERNGWSPTIAEGIGAQYAVAQINVIFNAVTET